jgi:hypothetical protein
VHHLDYLSCFLTVVSTVMVGRKHWMGLVIASINSATIGVIGLHTGQYGFIPANLFCIITYAWCVRSWRRDRKPALVRAAAPAPPVASNRTQPHTRALMPSRKVHTGLFLAYRASSSALIERQVAAGECLATNGLLNSGSVTGATTAN